MIQRFLPKFILKRLRPIYHGFISTLANLWFGRPSDKLIVIGVTGTNGKTTTVNLATKILEQAGYKVGMTSTATLKIGEEVVLNTQKMTMPSGWLLNKWLAEMVAQGFHYAIIEVSSEGLAYNRHLGINFDVAVFTNLTPEHIESHGGFEEYKVAKAKLFNGLSELFITPEKKAINNSICKTIITNLDDIYGAYYSKFSADKKLTYSASELTADVFAQHIRLSAKGISMQINHEEVNLQLKGQFDVSNSLAAAAIGLSQEVPIKIICKALEEVAFVPGRMEVFHANFFNVIVDYAYEPEEMRQLYETISRWPYKRAIQVLGPTGGGRDKARVPILGEMSARFADIVIITTDDPYDEDPEQLGNMMLEAAKKQGKIFGVNLFMELDRRKAIAQALSLAVMNDLVLVTGKGAEQKMAISGGAYIDWDDRKVVKEEMFNLQGF
jgi:UDP-N-acetylmuramoyl-L-alanyl-D-glutamate--2,6-diaminopimelate ligase